ncbi:MAG TPA: cysteine desulfurase family protein [Salinisphaeraceae bacterium]|nr:cysteine desulfurase family protein [Salinisphaeraceae bacterium]
MAIYLDHAASTPVRPEVIEHMGAVMSEQGANPASAHQPGRHAGAVVAAAAAAVAALIGAAPEDIIWTSGATEAINLALKGVLEFHGGGHVVSVASEHRATLDTLSWLERRGVRVTRLGVDAAGRVDASAVAAAIEADTRCVSIMHVNNETGVVQDIAAIGAVCAEHCVALHVDAAQSLGKLDLDVARMHIDLLSLSAHKMGGPQGAGALWLRPRIGLAAQIHGGGQQGNRRSGTLAVAQVAGFGCACSLAQAEMAALPAQLRALRQRLWQELAVIDGVLCNSPVQDSELGAPHILNISVPGVHGAALLTGLLEGTPALAVSAGSACSAARAESSHVLRAMGRTPAVAAASLRFSLGRTTTKNDIELAAARTRTEVARLRALAPRQLAVPA